MVYIFSLSLQNEIILKRKKAKKICLNASLA